MVGEHSVFFRVRSFQRLGYQSRSNTWTETVLFRFTRNSGGNPLSEVNFDKLGNLYATTSGYDYGSIFRLTPQGGADAILFKGAPDGEFPGAGVFIKGSVIYGTTQWGGAQNLGTLFQVQGRKETVLYSFCSLPNCADGFYPDAGLISMGGGLFGTTTEGGTGGKAGGVVFEITP
jgi:uncharacterized repeat protein (TIGR03803 family)